VVQYDTNNSLVEEVAEEFDDELFSRVAEIVDMMSDRIISRVCGPWSSLCLYLAQLHFQDISFSSVNEDSLKGLGLGPASAVKVKFKKNIAGIVAQCKTLGEDGVSSASVLQRHLELLERIVPQTVSLV
jgi:hypothetical protein